MKQLLKYKEDEQEIEISHNNKSTNLLPYLHLQANLQLTLYMPSTVIRHQQRL